jgi:hypothetical protein
MSDEKEQPKNANGDDTGNNTGEGPGELLLEGGANDGAPIIDGDFKDIPSPVKLSMVDDDDGDAIVGEAVAAPPTMKPAKSENDPLAALLADIPDNTDVTIVVKRKPDENLVFRIPCESFGLTTNVHYEGQALTEIYSTLQRRYGGGRYHFQLRYGSGLQPNSWVETINDPAEPSIAEQTASRDKANEREAERSADTSHHATQVTPPPGEDDMAEKFFDRLDKWTAIVDRVRPPAPAAVAGPTYDVKDQIILKMAERMADNPEVGESLMRKAFGLGSAEEKKGILEGAVDLLKHPQDLANIAQSLSVIGGFVSPYVGPLLGGLLGRRGAAPVETAMVPFGGMPISVAHRTVAPAATQAPANMGIVLPDDEETADTPPAGENEPTGPLMPPQQASQGQKVVW